jgi:hypothetical protein
MLAKVIRYTVTLPSREGLIHDWFFKRRGEIRYVSALVYYSLCMYTLEILGREGKSTTVGGNPYIPHPPSPHPLPSIL